MIQPAISKRRQVTKLLHSRNPDESVPIATECDPNTISSNTDKNRNHDDCVMLPILLSADCWIISMTCIRVRTLACTVKSVIHFTLRVCRLSQLTFDTDVSSSIRGRDKFPWAKNKSIRRETIPITQREISVINIRFASFRRLERTGWKRWKLSVFDTSFPTQSSHFTIQILIIYDNTLRRRAFTAVSKY